MKRSIRAPFVALLLLVSTVFSSTPSAISKTPAANFDGCPALGAELAQVVVDQDSIYAHVGPDFKSGTSSRLLRGQCFFAVGREKLNGFLLVRDGNSKLWVHGKEVAWRGDLQKLPYMDDFRATGSVVIGTPKGLPAISYKARQIYAGGAQQGRDLGIVTVMGDCNSEAPVYFGRIGSGSFNLGDYPSLAGAAGRFGRSWWRTSVATSGSFNTSSALDPSWANPALCGSDAPLQCELRLSRASIMIVALGTGDQFAWQGIEARFRPILDNAILGGVLPVLMTKADTLEHTQGGAPVDAINNVVRGLGAQYGIPVIDFALAARDLPNGGLANEPPPQFHLSTEGENLRIVMTLATLGSISAGVPYVPPAAPAATPVPSPSPASTLVVTTVPSPSPASTLVVTTMPSPSTGSNSAAPVGGRAAKPAGADWVIGTLAISDDQVNLRAAPDKTAVVIAAAKKDQRFEVIAKSDDGAWWKVRLPDEKSAWVFGELAVFTATERATTAPQIGVAYVKRSFALLRDDANFDATLVGRVVAGQMLNMFARNADGDWLKVTSPGSGDYRWVHADQVVVVDGK